MEFQHRPPVVAEQVIRGTRRRASPVDGRASRPLDGPFSPRWKRGGCTVRLDPVEFRILRLLASEPYRAFSKERIAAIASTPDQRVTPGNLDHHIARLRQSLGFFHDYVQRVPHIGYRFRA